tara:strand:+ start:761 stop:1021 length:261 start_codon:yes stop_codon:yes gene_type:complete
MFVYGKAGRKAPYVIKVLTQMQLSELLILQKETKKLNTLSIKSSSFIVLSQNNLSELLTLQKETNKSKTFSIKILSFLVFSDATHE